MVSVSVQSYAKTMILPALLLCDAFLLARERKDIHPNIIFIMADDLGYGDVSCYGQEQVRTPNIDALASQGMLFTSHYSGCALSAPSRAALLSGLHTGHTSVRGNGQNPETPEGQYPLSAESVTIAEVLKDQGYVTGAFGKWGLGFITTEGDPQRQGFDEFWGYNCQTVAHRYYPAYLWHNHEKVMLEGNGWKDKGTYSADFIHDRAMDFIEANKDTAFFLYYPTTLPHAEIVVPEDEIFESMISVFGEETPYLGKEGDTGTEYGDGMVIKEYCMQMHPHAAFASMILRLDKYVGEIMAKLKELGIDDNTIVFFTSDNGPHPSGGADPVFFDGNGKFKGIKGDFYEGGIRIPMIVRWNGHVKAGTTTDHPSVFYDIKPTVAEIVGSKIKSPTDGISFLPVLEGRKQKTHKYMYWELHAKGGMQAVRMGDWKGVRNKIGKNPDAPIELYNLADDISETKDLAAERPDILKKIRKIMVQSHELNGHFRFDYEK